MSDFSFYFWAVSGYRLQPPEPNWLVYQDVYAETDRGEVYLESRKAICRRDTLEEAQAVAKQLNLEFSGKEKLNSQQAEYMATLLLQNRNLFLSITVDQYTFHDIGIAYSEDSGSPDIVWDIRYQFRLDGKRRLIGVTLHPYTDLMSILDKAVLYMIGYTTGELRADDNDGI